MNSMLKPKTFFSLHKSLIKVDMKKSNGP